MKKLENEGALDLKKNNWDTDAPKRHRIDPISHTRNVNCETRSRSAISHHDRNGPE